MSDAIASRVLDGRDEHAECRACLAGPPMTVRRYYLSRTRATQLAAQLELCDRCAQQLAEYVSERLAVEPR